LLICELLVNGVSPAAIPRTLQATSAYFQDKEAKELPSTSYVRSCRDVVQNLNTMLVAYVLANSTAWTELFTDGTTRHQTPMQNLIIQFRNVDGEMGHVLVSSCIFSEDETSEHVSEAILDMVREEMRSYRQLHESFTVLSLFVFHFTRLKN
jgi:hypothetical protein